MKKTCGKIPKTPDEGEPFLQLSRKRAMGWAGIFIFVSVWTFVLGVLVGRGTAPVHFDMNRLQNELTDLKLQMLEKEREKVKKDSEALANRQTVDFYEVLKDKKADASITVSGPKGSPQPQVKPTAESAKTEVRDIPLKTKTPAPATVAEKKTTPETPKAPSNENPDGGKHIIQVAATRDTAAADQLVAKLTKSGYPAYRIVSRVDENNVWYRVRVGGFNNPEDAAGMLAAIKKNYPGALLISR